MSDSILIRGAHSHNLQHIDVTIPKNTLTIITGVSGSGKSSLAFHTLYNVGQQKYLESLSSYARMFIGGMQKEAHVDEIIGLSPTISIDQKTTNRNPRSTVGTITEIYDYYKLVFLHAGERLCTVCDHTVQKDHVQDIIDAILASDQESKYMILAPCSQNFDSFEACREYVLNAGFVRMMIGDTLCTINDAFSDTWDVR